MRRAVVLSVRGFSSGKPTSTTVPGGGELHQLSKKDGKVPVFVFDSKQQPKEKKIPSVIVLQEWWGVNEQVKLQAQHVANQGYRVVIPDLYRGELGLEVEEANHLFSHLDWIGALDDIQTCIDWTKKETQQQPVGVLGFCMGGALSIASGVRLQNIDAAVSFYGIPPLTLADPAKIKVPLLGLFGDLDGFKGFSDKDSVKELQAKLASSNLKHEFKSYPTQGHAFMNDTPWSFEKRKEMGLPPYDPQVVSDAWGIVFNFLSRHLKKK